MGRKKRQDAAVNNGTPKKLMVFTYLSEEEKKALEVMATLENRSTSNLVRVELVRLLKNRGLLEEDITEDGEIVQSVNVTGAVKS